MKEIEGYTADEIMQITGCTADNLRKNLIIALWVGVISVVVQFVCGYYLGSETPAIIGSLAAIIAIIAYAKVFARKSKVQDKETFTLAESLKAWK